MPRKVSSINPTGRLVGGVSRIFVTTTHPERELGRHSIVGDRNRGVQRLIGLYLVLDTGGVVTHAQSQPERCRRARDLGQLPPVVGVVQRSIGLRGPRVRVVTANQPRRVIPEVALKVRRNPTLRVGVLVVSG